MVCIRCQKRPAIIFIQRMVDGQMKQEGYCLHCARELHMDADARELFALPT